MDTPENLLQELLKKGAQQLLAQAIEAELAIDDGALDFWNAITKVWPTTLHQRCWVHKTANILNKVPKSLQPKIKSRLQDIWMAKELIHQI